MAENFSIADVLMQYPDVVNEDGKVDYELLTVLLARDISDLNDQLNEKDFQILRITERLDRLETR